MDKNIEAKIEEILTRGVENIYPSKKALKGILLSGKKLRIYSGIDPTGKLHLGHSVFLKKLRQFQDLGHEIIVLIGDFTGMIGDPTDKELTRKKLTREEVLKNSRDYEKQISMYLKFDGKNLAKIVHNSEWNDKLTFKDLIELSSNFTVQQMLHRSMFDNRMLGFRSNTLVKCRHCKFVWPSPIQFGDEDSFKTATLIGNKTNCPKCKKITGLDKEDLIQTKPIYLHEFLYPLAQAYDSVAMDIDLEIGGNDQTFNMLCGRDLMKAVKGKEKFVLTTKLLTDPAGKKMGKTENNIVNLDNKPENMFGKVMAWPDNLIVSGFELLTDVSMDEIKQKEKDMESGKLNPRDAKLDLAEEIVKIYHGEEKAKVAREYFIDTFSKQEIPKDIPEVKISEDSISVIDFMILSGNAKSRSDARRKIEQGGVSIEGERTLEMVIVDRILNRDDNGKVVKIGKIHFVKIKFQ